MTINPKPTTEKSYIRAMQEFTEWIGKTPNELLTEAEAEIKKGALMRERSIKRYLIGFRKHLQDVKYAPVVYMSY